MILPPIKKYLTISKSLIKLLLIATFFIHPPINAQLVKLQQNQNDLLAGEYRAIAYSGYRQGQHPDRGSGAVYPSEKEILEDLKILTKGTNFSLIRLYDSGENSKNTLQVIQKYGIKVKVMLGIWLNAELSNHQGAAWLDKPIPEPILNHNKIKNQQEVQNGIALANEYKKIIVAVNVGNEALVNWTDHLVDVGTIIAYVRRVKQGITQPVTVAENYDWWAKKGVKLAQELDFVTLHTYPVWEGKDINEGLSYTIANLESVKKTLPNSRLVIGEAGWATIASEFGTRAGEKKQYQYYHELFAWAKNQRITTFWFEAFDEDWKGNPANPSGAEKHWGLFTIDRKPKLVMSSMYPERK